MTKTWFITGASHGLGADMAKAALRAGDQVVAADRDRLAMGEHLGPDSRQLLAVQLDVSDESQAEAAVDAALARFGTIDVLVNNPGCGQASANLFGVFSVTRVVLPVMRAARRGRIFNVSRSSKLALEGFSESLAREVAPFGILVTHCPAPA
jgi:NAD(P)-dependent dehydrogenase (short-subunit alcohol dehydrogenase family)